MAPIPQPTCAEGSHAASADGKCTTLALARGQRKGTTVRQARAGQRMLAARQASKAAVVDRGSARFAATSLGQTDHMLRRSAISAANSAEDHIEPHLIPMILIRTRLMIPMMRREGKGEVSSTLPT